MKARLIISLCAVALLSAGCKSSGTGGFSLVTNSKLALGTAAGAALAIHLIYDPLAPNWEIEETRLSDDSYQLSMKMKRFHTGGAGEALQLLKRRALQLQQEQGFAGYQIASYSEGVDSQTLSTRRVAEGTLRFVRHEAADSFALNGSY